jgi:hypothetical protein
MGRPKGYQPPPRIDDETLIVDKIKRNETVWMLTIGNTVKFVFSTPEKLKEWVKSLPPKKQVQMHDFYSVREFRLDDPSGNEKSVMMLSWFMRDE